MKQTSFVFIILVALSCASTRYNFPNIESKELLKQVKSADIYVVSHQDKLLVNEKKEKYELYGILAGSGLGAALYQNAGVGALLGGMIAGIVVIGYPASFILQAIDKSIQSELKACYDQEFLKSSLESTLSKTVLENNIKKLTSAIKFRNLKEFIINLKGLTFEKRYNIFIIPQSIISEVNGVRARVVLYDSINDQFNFEQKYLYGISKIKKEESIIDLKKNNCKKAKENQLSGIKSLIAYLCLDWDFYCHKDFQGREKSYWD